MTRKVLLSFVLVMVLTIAGCTASLGGESTESDSPTETTSTEPETIPSTSMIEAESTSVARTVTETSIDSSTISVTTESTAAPQTQTKKTTTDTPEPSTERSDGAESTPTETATETEPETTAERTTEEMTTETATSTETVVDPEYNVTDPYCGLNGSDVSIQSVEFNENRTSATVHGTVEQDSDEYDALKVQFYVVIDTENGPQYSELVTVTVPRGTVDDWGVRLTGLESPASVDYGTYIVAHNEEEWRCQQ